MKLLTGFFTVFFFLCLAGSKEVNERRTYADCFCVSLIALTALTVANWLIGG